MRNDFKTAIRSLRKSPTFTAVALIVLALGIGAGTAIFSVVDAVVLRGLPFDEHDRLVAVLERGTHAAALFNGTTTTQTYLDWRVEQQAFDGLAAVSGTAFGLRDAEGHPQTVRATRVTAEFFAVLRVASLLGRTFTTGEETSGRHRVAILSYGFWQRQFGGSRDVVGKTVALDDESWDVVGVMPRDFTYPVASAQPPDIYVPPAFRDEDRVRADSRSYGYTAVGRLKPGVSIAKASDHVNRVAAALDAQYPTWTPGLRVRIVTLHEHLVGTVKSWMTMLLCAVALVLLIACANVANLLLARATVRGPEIAIRAALGASRTTLVRGLLVEAVVLSLGGAAIGILLAWVEVHAILPWLPAGLPRVASIGIDLRVLAAAVAAALVTGIGFGLVPALQSSRPNLSTALKDNTRSTTAGVGSHRLRSTLVVSEMALAVVLVVGAGLFIGSFAKLMQVEPGFDYRRVLAVNVGDIRDFGLEAPPRQEGYLPLAQSKVLGATLVMRTTGDPLRVLPAVKAAIWSVNKDQRIAGDIFTLEGFMDRLIAQRRFYMVLLALFGVIGLAISAVGIYGVMAYLVAQRTSEIGVRMALGATPGVVVAMVLRRAGLLVGLGLAIGTGASWYFSAAVKSFLFQVEPTDPRIFAGALLVLALAGLAASAVPACRAAAVDPIIALRRE